MGQQQLPSINSLLEKHPNIKNDPSFNSMLFAKELIENAELQVDNMLNEQQIQTILLHNYENSKNIAKKRRKSYESYALELEADRIMYEKIVQEQSLQDEEIIKALISDIEHLQKISKAITNNIAEIMALKKTYKIRQNFRKLILQVFNLENLFLYVSHATGRLQYHDFKNNYITEFLENSQKYRSLETLFRNSQPQILVQAKDNSCFSQIFDLKAEEVERYQCQIDQVNPQHLICLLYEPKSEFNGLNKKLINRIVEISMISTNQEENSIIQFYAKQLLDILQITIIESEKIILQKYFAVLSQQQSNFSTLLQTLIKDNAKNSLIEGINQYQEAQFQMLEKIRMYKKYACEDDKIFMDFDQSAQLTFLCNNFQHPLGQSLSKLWIHQKIEIQNVFGRNKMLGNLLKKAGKGKIKNNKMYELDFETRARVKFDNEGNIIRVHVIIEELNKESSKSSSNVYHSSSTKILSEDSSENQQDQELELRKESSTLVKNLEKQNPGIISEGWINLFIKDNHLKRQNNHLKSKNNKTCLVQRSYSCDKEDLEQLTRSEHQLKVEISKINIESCQLNLLALDEEFLEPFVIKVFSKLQFFHHIDKSSFLNFLSSLHEGYQLHNNPFHNFTHGVNVMHSCYILSSSIKCKEALKAFRTFTLIFSGLCHDVGHTGFTNLFQIASKSKKAITYNDNSPLQNFHASYTFELLRKPENNFLSELPEADFKQFRKQVISNILFTDIKEHFPLLKKFNSILKEEISPNEEYSNIVSGMIIHSGDFGGSAKDFQIAKEWSLKVNLEFTNQYKMEGQLSLPQTPFMKDLSNPVVLSKNQSGFLKVIVLPLYVALDEWNFCDLKTKKMRNSVEQNIKEWDKINAEAQEELNGKKLAQGAEN